MDRKLKRWEMALMLGLLCALVGGSWLGQEQHELADSVIRFHVIANSDSAQDQALKLAVRDRVLEMCIRDSACGGPCMGKGAWTCVCQVCPRRTLAAGCAQLVGF